MKALIQRIKSFRADVAGVAAIEFAYLVPLLMLMTFGTLEVGRAVMTHKRFQRATAMIGDLIAREQQLGATKADAVAALDGIMLAAQNAIQPYSYTPFKVSVHQLRANSGNAAVTTVEWAYTQTGHVLPITQCPQQKSMPAANMIGAGNASIVVDTQYAYTPMMSSALNAYIGSIVSNMTFKDTMAFSPRNGSVTYCTSCQDPATNPNYPCPP